MPAPIAVAAALAAARALAVKQAAKKVAAEAAKKAAKKSAATKKANPLPPKPKVKLNPEPSSVKIKTDKNKLPSAVMRVGKINDKLAADRKAAEIAKSSKRGLKAANKPLSKGNAKRVAEINDKAGYPRARGKATEEFRVNSFEKKKISAAQQALNKKLGKK